MGTSAADNQGQANDAVSAGVIHSADDHSGVIHAAGGDATAASGAGTVMTVDDVLANPDRARSLEFVHHVEQGGAATGAATTGATAGATQPSGAAQGNVGASGIPDSSQNAAGTSSVQPQQQGATAGGSSSATVKSVTVQLSDGTSQTLGAQS